MVSQDNIMVYRHSRYVFLLVVQVMLEQAREGTEDHVNLDSIGHTSEIPILPPFEYCKQGKGCADFLDSIRAASLRSWVHACRHSFLIGKLRTAS